MSRSRHPRKPHRADRPAAPRAPSPIWPTTPRDWLVPGLAFAGLLLTAYLTVVALSGGGAAFCAAGSSCDVVQQSRWSTLLGLPMATWGFGLYALIALAALFTRNPLQRWRRTWSLALLGLAISVYLNITAAVALDAACAWCLLSLALLAVLFGLLQWQRPAGAPGLPWRTWLVNNGLVVATLVAVIGLWQGGAFQPRENPRLRALAEHLDARGAKFYGAFWCPSCADQKALFGGAAERLPYVECTPNGRNGPIAFACVSANVQGFPTWVINGRSYQSVLQPEELARRSGFNWDGFDAAAARP